MGAITTCVRCGARLRWITMTSGARAAVDVLPDPLGDVAAYVLAVEPKITHYGHAHIITDTAPARPEAIRFRMHAATGCRPDRPTGCPPDVRDALRAHLQDLTR